MSVLAACALAGIATHRGEPINSIWLIVASVGTYLTGFRFYAKFIATRIMALDNDRS